MTYQHETSIVYRRAIEAGARVERIWTNSEVGDLAVSLVEFANADGVYLFDNCCANIVWGDFDQAIKAVRGIRPLCQISPVAAVLGLES